MTQSHPRPIYDLTVDGENITASLQGRLISLSLADNRGFEADQLDIVLDDADGRLDLPPRGAQIRLALGWQDSGLEDKGSYVVDEIEHSGAPDQLTLRARSADLRGGLSTQMERSFHGRTLGDIVRTIAVENDLIASIDDGLSAQGIEHLDQTNESSANLLTRLAGMFDAIATVKSGRLLFMPVGRVASAGGRPLERITLTRQDGDSHRFSLAERETYTAVRANWHDTRAASKGEVIWGKAEDDAEHNRRPAPAPTPAAAQYRPTGNTQKSRARAHRLAMKEWKRLSKTAGFRAQYAGVRVAYDDKVMGVQGEVTYGAADEEKARHNAARQAQRDAERLEGTQPQTAFEHSADNIKTLRHVYANKTNAARGARTEWRRLQRGMATFGITLARGRPELFPEIPCTVAGWKPSIDNTDWLITRVTHNLSNSGYTMALELEIRSTEIPG